MSSSFFSVAASVEVNWVTAMRMGRVPSGRVSPSRAARIMAEAPEACRFTISTSRRLSTAMARPTVLGMSWSFKSRKILWPRDLISRTICGPSA